MPYKLGFLFFQDDKKGIVGLDSDGGFDGGVGVVADEGDVFVAELVNFSDGGVELDAGERSGLAGELESSELDVVIVDMEVAKRVDEFAGAKVCDVGDHEGE